MVNRLLRYDSTNMALLAKGIVKDKLPVQVIFYLLRVPVNVVASGSLFDQAT
jgi:hypothetical protein